MIAATKNKLMQKKSQEMLSVVYGGLQNKTQTNKDAFSTILCLLTPGLNSLHSKHMLHGVRSNSSYPRAMWNMTGAPWWDVSVMLKLTPGIL